MYLITKFKLEHYVFFSHVEIKIQLSLNTTFNRCRETVSSVRKTPRRAQTGLIRCALTISNILSLPYCSLPVLYMWEHIRIC